MAIQCTFLRKFLLCALFLYREDALLLVAIIIDFCRQYIFCRSTTKHLQIPCKLELKCDDANNNYYMKIILAKFKFDGLVMICQFAKFSFPPRFVVIRYVNDLDMYLTVNFI